MGRTLKIGLTRNVFLWAQERQDCSILRRQGPGLGNANFGTVAGPGLLPLVQHFVRFAAINLGQIPRHIA